MRALLWRMSCFRIAQSCASSPPAGSRSAPTRQQTLRATLDWSFDLLELEGQRRFEALAVFAGSFDLDAVEAVWTVENPPSQLERDSLEVLTELVDRSLVMLQPRAG